MVKYLSGRVKRTPQDQLKDDRYQYLNLEQAEPNLADPPTPTSEIPPGSQFQLVSIPGHPGKRYWVPIGGGLIAGAVTIFDEGSQVSGTSSITQLNFVGAAVTAEASVQSPSGHPGVAATITVIPVTVGDNPPIGAGTTNNGELWWESDTGDLYVYYDDGNTSQWVQANAGGRGLAGDKGEKGEPSTQQGPEGEKGSVGEKGAPGNVLAKGVKGDPGVDGTDGSDGSDGDKGNAGDKGEPGVEGNKGDQGVKGQKGEIGVQGDKAGILYNFSNANTMVDPNAGNFRFNSSSLSSVSQISIDALDKNGNDFSDFITTWDDSTDNIKGILSIKSNDNTDTSHTIFQVSSITDNTGFLIIGVQNGVGNIPSNLETCVLNFSRTGEKGASGDKGVTDKIIEGNTEAEVVDTGTDGHFKVTTEGIERFRIDNVGLATFTNDVVISNTLFLNKTTGEICKIDHDGADLDLHADSEIRFFESDSDKLMFTFDVNTTNNDARIILENDTDTFFNHPADNQLGFTVGGTETIRIETGKVGINNNSPSTTLDVTGDIRAFSGANALVQLTSTGSIELKRTDGAFIDFATAGTEDKDVRIRQVDNGLKIETGGNGSVTEKFRVASAGQIGLSGANYGLAGQVLTSQGNSSAPTWTTQINTQLTTEQVEDIVGDMFSGNTETRINATYADNGTGRGKINLVVDDQSADNNTTYSLPDTGTNGTNFTTARGSATITLTGSDATTDAVVITAGDNIKITDTGSGGFTINAQDTNTNTNTTYDLVTSTSGSDIKLKLDASTGASDDDEITITAGSNITLTDDSNGGFTIDATNTNTQLTTEQVEDIVGNMFSGNTETRISATYADNGTGNGKINLVVDDQSADNNTEYNLEVIDGGSGSGAGTGNDSIIRLNESTGTDYDVTLIAGTNVTLAHSTSNDSITISTSGTLDVTQLDLNRIRFGPGNAINDDANIEWLGGSNNGYLRISTSDDGGSEYIELGDYGSLDISGSFTQWMKLRRSELTMESVVRTKNDLYIDDTLRDKDGQTGSNGQVLVATSSGQVNWVDPTSGGVNSKYDFFVPSGSTKLRLEGATSSGNNNDDIEIFAGTGISVTRDSSTRLTITNTDTGSGANQNFYLTGLSFNTSNGILTGTVNGASNPTVDLDGRYVLQSTGGTSGVPSGTIVLWSGSIGNIPSGWELCDGSNGTPDLRNRFVVGAHSDGANTSWPNLPPGNTGGSNVSSLPAHSHTINNHTHSFSTTSNPGSHFHYTHYAGGQNGTGGTGGTGRLHNRAGDNVAAVTSSYNTGSDPRQDAEIGARSGNAADAGRSSNAGGHTHSGTTGNPSNTGTNSQGSSATNANLPPYYALCYIMKS